jgi:glycosyltransferase involved in cell wall biosynthesis
MLLIDGMKIALFHPWIHTKGGIERTILEIVKRSRHKYTIFTMNYVKKKTFPEFKKFDVKTLSKKLKIGKDLYKWGYSFGKEILLQQINLSGFDAFNIHTGGVGEIIAINNHEIPIVCYCHTILRSAHNMYNEYINQFSGFQRLKVSLGLSIYRFFEKWAWKYFDLVLCNSKNVRKRILGANLAPSNKINVLHPGVDTKRFKQGKFGNYFLCPGRIGFYKRTMLAAKAFKEFKKKSKKRFKLIIAGHVSDKDKSYLKKLKAFVRGDKDIKLILSPSDQQLLKLYKNCYAVLFSAMDEDWGLVPLEGMASGKPVISVNEGGPKENIINGSVGYLVNPSPEAFAKKMLLLSKSIARTRAMGKRARKHVMKYDWDNFVKKFDDYMESVI